MAKQDRKTVFQNLTNGFLYGFDKDVEKQQKKVHSYTINNNDVILKTKDKDEFEKTKAQIRQEKYLANQWVSAGLNLNQTTALVSNNLKLMYRDSDVMDGYPEIGAALDLYAEETCNEAFTEIKLLNGDIKTIESLYNENYKDFWTYSIDENGVDCKPTKIERVVCNGVKPILKVTLDDGTEIKCTHNHKWLLSDNTWIRTDKLKIGDSLMSIYDNKNYLGYEQIISTNSKKKQLTHRMVAENVLHDKKVELSNNRNKTNEPYQKLVIHHKSFDKLNNDPEQLEYMYWADHQKLHTDLNTERWKNPEFADKMRKILGEATKNNWKNNREKLIESRKGVVAKAISKMSKEERDEKYGRKNEQNGMFGSNRIKDLNPNYNSEKKHISDINEDEYIAFVLECNGNYRKSIAEKFNLVNAEVIKYNKIICKKYGVSEIKQLKFKIKDEYSINHIKNYVRLNPQKNIANCAKFLNIDYFKIPIIIRINGYKNWNDLVKNVNNHRVVKIEEYGEGMVYDMINSSTNHCFGVKCNTGQIISHNCVTNTRGQILNITSKSDRIKKILDDLFVNRLDIHINLPMWTRSMCKYGNAFVMLNITNENGVIGARQLPVYEIERIENGVYNPYISVSSDFNKNRDTEFIWIGQNVGMPFKSWQIAHFRLLTDSLFLPYGVSILHKARRHFRILSMMEDMMLIYRLERSIERRVFKIFVGNIDDADIPAYVQEIANTFKRTPIIDPETGQLDIRKNMMDVSHDIFIPVKDASASTPIDVLAGASNLDKIEDLKYIQNKLLTALRIPKEFLNFEESAGDGKNLAIKDIRFTRTINRIQQALIMELTKIAVIHLYLNGFTDELTNFKITMNNPSTQSEILKLEELSKKINLVTTAVQDPGNGIQIYSLTRAQREILGWSDEELTQNMLEIRMEKALAAELAKTEQIIKRTGLFDKVDDMYGEPNAEYASGAGLGDEQGGPGGGGFGGGGFGGGIDGDISGESGGEPGSEPEGESLNEPANNEGGLPPIEGGLENETIEPETPKLESTKQKVNNLLSKNNKLLTEKLNRRRDTYLSSYINYINNNKRERLNENIDDIVPIISNTFMKNEETNQLIGLLDKKLKK